MYGFLLASLLGFVSPHRSCMEAAHKCVGDFCRFFLTCGHLHADFFMLLCEICRLAVWVGVLFPKLCVLCFCFFRVISCNFCFFDFFVLVCGMFRFVGVCQLGISSASPLCSPTPSLASRPAAGIVWSAPPRMTATGSSGVFPQGTAHLHGHMPLFPPERLYKTTPVEWEDPLVVLGAPGSSGETASQRLKQQLIQLQEHLPLLEVAKPRYSDSDTAMEGEKNSSVHAMHVADDVHTSKPSPSATTAATGANQEQTHTVDQAPAASKGTTQGRPADPPSSTIGETATSGALAVETSEPAQAESGSTTDVTVDQGMPVDSETPDNSTIHK
eukprot:GHVT01002117.1.p1 GENE.GHVT01002117.1~~GHVT01002117.1.p1  ORF type:complete len:329 (+),score=34.60 GHVT01002117.1:545-1531(+)